VYAFDSAGLDNCSGSPRSCRPIWSGATAGAVTSSPAVQSGRVYVGSADSLLYEFAPCVNPHSASGLAPCDLTSAYRLPALAGAPTRTVAVVDAFGDPTAESDLAAYRAAYHLPPCTTANGCFAKINQRGLQSSYPAANTGWALETSLDLDMVSAICPLCHIVLGESDSDAFTDLAATQDTVAALAPAAISDSFGGTEYSGETAMDADFVHAGIVTVASTGDDGYPGGAEYPAVIPLVTSVGGTTLTFTGSGRGWSETAWNSTPGSSTPTAAGSGCSTFEAKPLWQHDVACAGRTVADVSAAASNLATYDTTGHGGWISVQGTSAAAPMIASLWAITGSTAGVAHLYATPGGLYDVINGSNGPGCGASYLCDGMFGYDGPTGVGTPCGLSAWGGTSPAGCGVTASPFGAVAHSALGGESGGSSPSTTSITPVCGEPRPGHARCFAWVASS
jgi:subtilase family serine protease